MSTGEEAVMPHNYEISYIDDSPSRKRVYVGFDSRHEALSFASDLMAHNPEIRAITIWRKGP